MSDKTISAFSAFEEYKKRKEGEAKSPTTSQTTSKTPSSGGTSTAYSAFEEYQKRKNGKSTVDADYINTFVSESNTFFDYIVNEYSRAGYANSSTLYDYANSRLSDLNSKRSNIRIWLDGNRDKIGEEAYTSIRDMLDSYDKSSQSILGAFESKRNFYGQFATEDDYNAYEAERQKQQRYADIAKDEEWARAWASEETFRSPTAEEVNAEKYASEKAERDAMPWWERALSYLGGVQDTTLPLGSTPQLIHDLREDESYKLPTSEWSEDQRRVYDYLRIHGGAGEASEYAISVNNAINQAEKDAYIKSIEDFATDNLFSGAVSTAGAILASPLGLADYLADLVEMNARGTITTTGEVTPFEFSQATTGSISQELNELGTLSEGIPIIGGKGLGDVYGLGTSIAQSSLAAYTGGSPQALITFFGSAAASATDDALSRGATEEQALMYGTASGLAEALAEMVGVENLLKIGASYTVKELIVNIAKQATSEGIEELLTSLANNISDNLILQDNSQFNALVKQYMLQGMSEEEAKNKAWLETAEGIIYDGLAGFVSGSVHSAPHTMVQTSSSNKKATEIYGDNAQDLVTEALAMPEGSESRRLAEEYQKKLDSGKTLSGAELNRLVAANEQAMRSDDISKITTATETRLTELGENGDVARIAVALAKQATGEKLSMSEKNLLKNSQYATRVANELNPTNIESEGYSSEWAEKIGTERINPEAYNKELYNLAMAQAGVTNAPQQTSVGERLSATQSTPTHEIQTSESGNTTQVSTGETIAIDKNNAIAKNEMVNGELVVYLNTDKGVVKASDVQYASRDEGLLYESFVDMNPAFANAVIKNYDGKTPIQTYIRGMREGIILYGANNFQAVGVDIAKDSFLADLPKVDQDFALKLGRAYAKTRAKKAETAIRTENKGATGKHTKGRVRFENGAKAQGTAQKQAVTLARHLSAALGVDIVFYDATKAGTKVRDANGYYDKATGTIHLDLQNHWKDKKTIVFTLSHELVHHIKQWSPAKFNAFANFLMEQYAAHGVDTSKLLANKLAELGTEDADLAYEEMIADACESLLLDSNAVEKLTELAHKDRTLFEKIRDFIKNLLNKIRAYYKEMGFQPSSEEGKALLKMQDVMEQIHGMFEDALVAATQNYQASKELDTEAASMSEDGTIRLQMKQYDQTGRDTLLRYLREQYGASTANDLISTIDNIYSVMAEIKKDTALSVFGNWQDTEVELDADGRPIFTTSINNGDYELNQDFSRVCKKRRQLNFVLNMLAEDPAFNASHLTSEDFVKINKAIKEHGFEIACALCFVDSKRYRQTEWADSFASTWNDILYSVVSDRSKLTPFNFATSHPNLSDDGIEIDTSKPVTYRKWSDGKEDVKNRRSYDSFDYMLTKNGKKFVEGNANVRAIATLIRDNPQLRHTFRGADIIASDGFDSIQRLAPEVRAILDGWGGSSVPKPSSNDAIYDNSILNIQGYNAEKAFAVGGVRMNSFSDFMAHMFFDYAQAFADLSAKKLPMHSYTKELDFARLFGLTGGKINMSAIAAIRSGATDLKTIKGTKNKKAATDFERSVAGLDISRLAEKLGKDENSITHDDVIENLDDVDYVWADESIDVKSATLLQTGILYDRLTNAQASYCYELIRNGQIEEAFRVAGEENVNRGYAKHLGIITVGVSKAHIIKLLRDPTIRMVIPYHKSGLNPVVAEAMNIAFYDDFTPVQNTSVKNGDTQVGITKDGAKVKGKTLKDFSFYDYFGKTIDGVFYDGKATAAKYLDWCKNGVYDETVGDYVYYFTGGGYILASELHAMGIEVVPKFNDFASEENYYKLVEDFDCYDTITGEHSSQDAVDLFHDGLPADYKDVLVRALKAEQKVSDDFKEHLDRKGLRDEIMAIVSKRGYKPSDGIRKQAKPSTKNPELLDPRTVTEADVVEMLNNANNGVYAGNSYIPIRISTPPVLIRWAKAKRGDIIDDNPIIMPVDKALQAMARKGVDEIKRPHKLSVNDIISIIKNMNAPRYIVYQGANGRYVEVIDYITEDGRKVFAVLEIGDNKDFVYMNGYEGDLYNVLVTAYPPDAGKLRELLNGKQNEVIFDKEKDDSQRTSSSIVPSVLNDSPFAPIIPQADESVKGDEIKFQKKRDPSSYAPVFYSQMQRLVEGIKMDKMGASSVVNFLKGKGVRHDEIKWSGIEAFLEGKKSVTKQELLDFLASSQLEIQEQMSDSMVFVDEDGMTVTEEEFKSVAYDIAKERGIPREQLVFTLNEEDGEYFASTFNPFDIVHMITFQSVDKSGDATRWSDYTLDGGSNYRELVFTMPNSSYSNRAMRVHWGEDAEGVLAHARIQDMTTADGKKMLFVEEIQSDWHNEGHAKGYSTEEYEEAKAVYDRLAEDYQKMRRAFNKYVRSSEFRSDPDDVSKKKFDWLRNKMETAEKRMLDADRHLKSLEERGMGDTPDAPFRDSYHEYVMKRLIRMAAEEGYGSIGWTPADIQVDRWSEEFAEGYRIEYDQDIPKFLRKYGKRWGTTVGKTILDFGEYTEADFLRDFREQWESRWEGDDVEIDTFYDSNGRYNARAANRDTGEVSISTMGDSFNPEVWSMDITDSMQESVLYEGQPMFQKKDVSNRTILANALESTIDASTPQGQSELQSLRKYQGIIGKIEELEAQRADLSAQAHELRFKKGRTPEETKRMNELQFAAKQAENRIHTYDRQLIRLEAMSPVQSVLQREKEMVRKRTEAKGREALAKAREKAAKTQRELLDRVHESRRKAVEGRRKTELRHKIKGVVDDLNKLLLRPTKDKHIKEGLRKVVADALLAINMDTTGADERIAKYNALIAKATDPDVIAELTKTRDRIQLSGERLKDRLDALRLAYEKIEKCDDSELMMSYQEVIKNSIQNVSEKVGNTSIRNMTHEQLEMVYELVTMIRKTIRDSNKLFKESKQQTVIQTAEAVNDEIRRVGGEHYKRNVISAALRRMGWSLLKPYVAFRTIGSDTLTGLYRNLRAGEDTFYEDVSAAQAFIEAQYEKHGFKSWDMKETKEFTAKSGKTFKLTLEQMMSLYAYSRREQAIDHILKGGIVFEDAILVEKNKLGIPVKYEVTTKSAFNLSEETLGEIASSLTAEQKAFVEEMQEYLSTTMGAKGNEVSMELLGVKIFKEAFYFPLKSSHDYMGFKPEEAGEIKLKNPAFSKETVKHANNPVVIHNFTDLWAEHVSNMSMYHAFVLALEDFTRVYNYKTRTDDKVETMSTKATLESAYTGATQYINNFLKSLNGGVRMDTIGFAETLTSLAKKGAVLGSASVAIQQPSAIMRAMAYINPIHFVASAPKSMNLLKHKADWEELKKYAPIAGIKEMGKFDIGMGKGTADWIKSQKTAMDKVEDVLSVAPAFMDEVTWVAIWNAVKRETLGKNPKLNPTSEEFLKIAGERFTEVVSLSQVYDSVFSRSDIMRNKSWIAKALTAFMAEPTTTLNMLWDAWVQAKRSGSKGKFAKITAGTAGAVLASIVFNSALKALILAGRDDDEDESYVEKYLEHFFGDLKDGLNPLSLIPYVKDIVSIFNGYDVERMDVAIFSDIKNAIDAFDSNTKTDYEKWSGLVGAVSALFGIPVKNVERDIRAAINTFFGKKEATTGAGLLNAIVEGWTGETKSNGQQLYEAMLNGDADQIKRVKGRFKDQTAINSAIRKALRENDPRIKEAAQAIIDEDYDKYTRIANGIIKEGHFSETDVVSAIKSEVNAMDKSEETTEDKDDKDDKEVSLYEMDYFVSAAASGDTVMAHAIREDIIRTAVANGKDREDAEKSFNTSFQNRIRDEYDNGNLSDSEVVNMLVSYAGKTEKEASSKIQYWDFKQDYPDTYVSEYWIDAYNEDVAGSGVSLELFIDYKNAVKDIEGDGAKARKMQVIDSLPISNAQKDALYYAEGWASSKLWEAPWR